ncbi:MAG TPA: mucoidy inhibitor MuiA family protein, partial [Bacteroidia bacterium]|nr:mucoidy inhibitor MuiA family protein [Bacteroidia bacterium]
MKKILSILLLLPFFSHAGENEQKIEAPISSVIVYLTGGEIIHKKQVTLAPGRNELVFVGLSSHLIAKSIQFTASGDVSLLAISNRVDYLFGQKKSDERLKSVSDSMIMMEDNLAITRGNIDAYNREKTMLEVNQEVGGEKGTTAAELKLSADFYYQRTLEINTELVKLRRKEKNQQEVYNRLTQQYYALNQREHPPMAEITILVNNTSAAKLVSDVELHYVVSDCGWAPSYDLIAEDVGKPIDLKYRAKVFNSTDVDWKSIKMKLSTADPMQSAIAPVMEKWTLNYQAPAYNHGYQQQQQAPQEQQYDYNQNAPVALSSQNIANESKGRGDINGQVQPVVEYEQIQVSELAAEFDIKQL